jgi:hypothetical protein
LGYQGAGGGGRPGDNRLRRRRGRPDHDRPQRRPDNRRREPDRCAHQWRDPDLHNHITVKPAAKPDLAVASNPPAAERSAHRRPDDHQTEAIDHDDIIDHHHHHDHDRPVNERSALTTGCLGGSTLSGQLTLKRRRVPGGCGT